VNFFLPEKQGEKTPNVEEELQLILAGLGKRSLAPNKNITHSEVCIKGVLPPCLK